MVTLNIDLFMAVALIFIRISAIVFTLPIFGDNPVPVRARIFLSLALSIAFYNSTKIPTIDVFDTAPLALILLVVKEVMIGFFFGFIARVTFSGLTAAASLVGYQMGFGTANLLTTDADMVDSAFTEFHRIILFLIFLSLNLHFIFINGINDTFQLIPVGKAIFNDSLTPMLINLVSNLFSVALKLSAPVLIALLFTTAAMGLMGRAVPQINIFVLSFPASFFLGLIVYIATIPFFPEWFTGEFAHMKENIALATHMMTLNP